MPIFPPINPTNDPINKVLVITIPAKVDIAPNGQIYYFVYLINLVLNSLN